MDFQEAKDEFAVRYYRWASTYLQREFENDFPLLRMIKSCVVLRYLEYLKDRSRDEQYVIATAVQKRWHRRALELTGGMLMASEEEIIRDYLHKASFPTDYEESIWEMRFKGQGPVKTLKHSHFIKIATQELSKLPIPLEKEKGTSYLDGQMTIGEWTVRSTFYIGQPPRNMQAISHKEYFDLKAQIHILSWLGLTSGLVWDMLLTNEDGLLAAQSMRMASAGFLEAAPALLDGLTADSNLASK